MYLLLTKQGSGLPAKRQVCIDLKTLKRRLTEYCEQTPPEQRTFKVMQDITEKFGLFADSIP